MQILPKLQCSEQTQINFQQKEEGVIIDRAKHKKDIQEFRQTKMNMRKTRRQHALHADPFKLIDKSKQKQQPAQDLDDILKDLEERRLKRQQPYKMTKKHFKKTKERFYTEADSSLQLECTPPPIFHKAISPEPSSNNLADLKKFVSNKMKHQPSPIQGRAILGYAFQPSLPTLNQNTPLMPQKRYKQNLGSMGERRPHYLSNNKVVAAQQIQRYRPKALSPIVTPLGHFS